MTNEKKIQETNNQLRKIELLEHYLKNLSFNIKEAYKDLEKSNKILEKEHQDVIRLEELSQNWLYTKLRGDQEEKLEKEREEYYEAFLQNKEALKSIELLEFEEKVLREKLDSLRPRQLLLKKELLELLEEQEKGVSSFHTEKRKALTQVNRKIDQQHRQIKEAEDCIEVCRTMTAGLNGLFDILQLIHQENMLYDRSKRRDLNQQVEAASLKYRQIDNKRKRLKKELRQLYNKWPNIYIKDAINRGNIRAQMMKEIIPPAFLDPSFSQKRFWRVSLLYSMEEIEKLQQHLEQLASFLQAELDYLLHLNLRLQEEKAEILLKE